MNRPAFTLVEIVIVVLILGIIAAVSAGHFVGLSEDATDEAMRTELQAIQSIIEIHTAMRGGIFPSTIRVGWFRSGQEPKHPGNSWNIPVFEIINNKTLLEPDRKVLSADSAGAYWYNSAIGKIRSRVPWQGNVPDTRRLYNMVNSIDFTGTIEAPAGVVDTGGS